MFFRRGSESGNVLGSFVSLSLLVPVMKEETGSKLKRGMGRVVLMN